MLPVSGAEQLNTSGAIGERPMISQSGAYSKLLNPAPCSSPGMNRFHRPAARALSFISAITGGTAQWSSPAACCS
jgi:hypothetical protein